MKRFQLENLYEINGLSDYKLFNTIDLLKTHGVDYSKVEGFSRLDDLNKALYGKFIINFFNAFGLESRATIIPKAIYFVEDTPYLVKEDPADEYFTVAGGNILAVDRNGLKTVLYDWVYDDYKELEITQGETKTYLRFEYEHEGRSEWLHVTGEREWY